jgi:predicted dehydrogenase
VTYESDGRRIEWEGVSWSRGSNKSQVSVELRGEEGTLYVDDGGYRIYDLTGKLVEKESAGRGDVEHVQNFLDCVRKGGKPNVDIEEGHKSTLFCHLGNIAHRTGQSINVDPKTGHIVDNSAAEAFWAREYRSGWMPTV